MFKGKHQFHQSYVYFILYLLITCSMVIKNFVCRITFYMVEYLAISFKCSKIIIMSIFLMLKTFTAFNI